MYARFQGPNEWLKWALVIKIIDHNAINIYRRKFKIRKVCMWRKCRYDFRIEISLLHWCSGKCTWFEVVPKLNALEHGSDLGVHVLKDLAATSQGLLPAEQEPFSVATRTTWRKPKAPCSRWSFLASFLNQPIGLLSINDELEDVFILYAPASDIMRNYSHDVVQASIEMNNSRIMDNLRRHPPKFWRTF